MKNLTKKEQKIAKRQEMLTLIMPNAISTDYISSVNRNLPNGFKVATFNINENGYAVSMMAFKDGETKIYNTNDTISIQGVPIHFITI